MTNSRLIPYLFALPALLIMALGLAWPVIESLGLSMYELRLGEQVTPQAFRGLSIFFEALSDPSAHTSMLVTLKYAVVVVAFEVVIGVSLALLLEKPIRGMSIFQTIFVLPMMIAPICVGLIWRYMFDTTAGTLNTWLAPFNLKPE
jgi:multiple sugar transport system permease protein